MVPAQKAVGAPTAYENPSAALVPVGGRVTTVDGRGMAKTFVTLTDEEGRVRVTLTNGFGYYDFDEVESGKTYIITPVRTGYQFESRVVSLSNEQGDLDFVGIE